MSIASHVNDPIYGRFVLPPDLQQAVAHPDFQRLYGIAQLGFARLIPGLANLRHSRAEHCQGTAYLAGIAGMALDLNAEELLLLQMAALLHDVGHGPFSHAFGKVSDVRHEEQSQIITRNNILRDIWSEEWIATVCYVIDPAGPPPNASARRLQDIVANKFCHLDVDKLDYLLRDSYYYDVPFVSVARVVEFFYHTRLTPEGRWEFEESQRDFLKQVFTHREYMFGAVYHRLESRLMEQQMVKAALSLQMDWRDLPTFLSYNDVNFLGLIARTPAGQQLLKGQCEPLETVIQEPDPQAPITVLAKIPFYTPT